MMSFFILFFSFFLCDPLCYALWGDVWGVDGVDAAQLSVIYSTSIGSICGLLPPQKTIDACTVSNLQLVS